jgi:hypothetical protein
VENRLYITRGAFDACRKKELVVNGKNTPKHWRYEKFVKRGWAENPNNHSYTVDSARTGDYNQAVKDSYDQIVQKAVADMLHNIKPGTFTITDDIMKDIDIEAFKAMVK